MSDVRERLVRDDVAKLVVVIVESLGGGPIDRSPASHTGSSGSAAISALGRKRSVLGDLVEIVRQALDSQRFLLVGDRDIEVRVDLGSEDVA